MGRFNRDNHDNYERGDFSREDNNFDRNFDAREYSRDVNVGQERRDSPSNYDPRASRREDSFNQQPPIARDNYRGAPAPRDRCDDPRRNDDYHAKARPRYEDNRSGNNYYSEPNSMPYEQDHRQSRPSRAEVARYDDRKAEDVRRIQEMSRSGGGTDVTICSPKSYSDVQNLIMTLKNNQALIVDTDKIAPKDMQRYLDFLSGAIYALGGSHQKVGKSLMLFTPAGSCITVPCDIKDRQN